MERLMFFSPLSSTIEDDSKKEKLALSNLMKKRLTKLLSVYGKKSGFVSDMSSKPFEFNDTFKIGKNKINFSLKSDDLNPNDAGNLYIQLPILNETLHFTDKNKVLIEKEDVKLGREIISENASFNQILKYSEYLTFIESQFPVDSDPVYELEKVDNL